MLRRLRCFVPSESGAQRDAGRGLLGDEALAGGVEQVLANVAHERGQVVACAGEAFEGVPHLGVVERDLDGDPGHGYVWSVSGSRGRSLSGWLASRSSRAPS